MSIIPSNKNDHSKENNMDFNKQLAKIIIEGEQQAFDLYEDYSKARKEDYSKAKEEDRYDIYRKMYSLHSTLNKTRKALLESVIGDLFAYYGLLKEAREELDNEETI
jgi:translation initiation factor 2 beta subunit (eIF-2beta)/eIF-5